MKADSSGRFVYVELKHSALSTLSLLEARDTKIVVIDDEFTAYATKWLRTGSSRYVISGRLLFKAQPLETASKIKVHLINELDEIVQSKLTDDKGGFIFEDLAYNQKLIIKIENHN